ncbi:hypothetical protein [Candidatus Spongiihabitans sp.]|uniref:hypothetical protein n=1 Tax=Candidatus Spongiihabitans sp. TaxID=3101308 RepID=UPI003C7D8657
MINIKEILICALKKRCVFHSEADFQHHLAWWIHKKLDNAELRLEYPFSQCESKHREYCDIFLRSPYKIGIELKYKTKSPKEPLIINEDPFELRNQGAQDTGRYDFLKDVSRLEHWCEQNSIDSGYAIMLTNDHLYWNKPVRPNTNDENFRIHDRTISGELAWREGTAASTMQNHPSPICLKNKYDIKWEDAPCYDFKYLLLEIKQR